MLEIITEEVDRYQQCWMTHFLMFIIQFAHRWGIYFVQFLWNSFISKEAVAAERRYEKETSTCIQVAFRARTYLLSPLPLPPHLLLTDAIREAGWLCFLRPPPPSSHALPKLKLCDFQRPRPKVRMASS
jgi:hypothetical protein